MIQGLVIPKDAMTAAFGLPSSLDGYDWINEPEGQEELMQNGIHDIKIFEYPLDSPPHCEMYVFGIERRRYYKKNITCSQSGCTFKTQCDDCFQTTEYGRLPIYESFDSVKTIPNEYLCNFCYNFNATDWTNCPQCNNHCSKNENEFLEKLKKVYFSNLANLNHQWIMMINFVPLHF